MPNHFSTIGFDVQSYQEFMQLASQVTNYCKKIETGCGDYKHWMGGYGEQLWLQYDSMGEFIGMNPHFKGKSSVKIELLSHMHRECDSELDGTYQALICLGDVDSYNGKSSILIDSPDSSRHYKMQMPCVVEIQIAAFAHEVICTQANGEAEESLMFVHQSLQPNMSFTENNYSAQIPESMAILSGVVLESSLQQNEITDLPFYWVLLKSTGGLYDVVIDPEMLGSLPEKDNMISGTFWLSGQIKF